MLSPTALWIRRFGRTAPRSPPGGVIASGALWRLRVVSVRAESGSHMEIKDVVYAVGRSGYVNKDLMAVKAGAEPNGFVYRGKPVLPGFEKIVQPGTVVSVM